MKIEINGKRVEQILETLGAAWERGHIINQEGHPLADGGRVINHPKCVGMFSGEAIREDNAAVTERVGAVLTFAGAQ